MNQGFILLHRKFISWEWYQDKNAKILFIHCLLKANFETKEWQGIIIERGQFFTSINHLSIDLKMSTKEIRTALKKLQKTNEITQKGASNGTMITVCKYDSYQSETKTKGKRGASEGQAKGKRGATTNNDNNDNNENNDTSFEKFWDLYDKKIGKKEKVQIKWNNLSLENQNKILAYLPKYKIAQPDKQYRKNPETFLNNESWNDEIISSGINGKQEITPPQLKEIKIKHGMDG